MRLRPDWATQGGPVLENKGVKQNHRSQVLDSLLVLSVCVIAGPFQVNILENINFDVVTLCSRYKNSQSNPSSRSTSVWSKGYFCLFFHCFVFAFVFRP